MTLVEQVSLENSISINSKDCLEPTSTVLLIKYFLNTFSVLSFVTEAFFFIGSLSQVYKKI